MIKKNRLAVRTEYFKKSQVDAEKGHVMRIFADNKNTFSELTKNNFGLMEMFNKRYEDAKKALGKSMKKNSNILIDSVLVLPADQLDEMRNSFKKEEEFQFELKKTIIAVMNDVYTEQGFYPLGFEVHLDEGTKQEDGSIKLNPHAHMLFANYCNHNLKYIKKVKRTQKDGAGKAIKDKKNPKRYVYERDGQGNVIEDESLIALKGKMPLQHYQQRGSNSVWSRQQDIATKHFEKFGFERGLSKELTQAEHKSKEQFVKDKLKKAEQAAIEAELRAEKALISEQKTIENQKILNSENDKLLVYNAALKNENNALREALNGIEIWAKGIISHCSNSIKIGIKHAVLGVSKMKSHETEKAILRQVELIESKAFETSPDLQLGTENLGDNSIVEPIREVIRQKMKMR